MRLSFPFPRPVTNVVAAAPVAGGSLRRLLDRLWPLFVMVWLVFLVTGPVTAMLQAPQTPGRMLMAVGWTGSFVAAYLWLMLDRPFTPAPLTTARGRGRLAALALLGLLVLGFDLAQPPGWFWLFIYVVIPAGLILPPRAAGWAIVAATLLAAGVDVARGTWEDVLQVPGVAIWGISILMLRQLVVIVDELRETREELAQLAVAEERLRFARDLHDLLGHSLSLISLKSQLAGRLVAPDTPAATEITDIERVARRALREVRETVSGYRQPTLTGELAGAREMLAAAGITAQVEVAGMPFPAAVDTALAWTVREGITNIIRHSQARSCWLTITAEAAGVRATIADDGRGGVGDGRDAGGDAGSGLAGLAERIGAAGGALRAGPGAAGGFALEVTVPLPALGDVAGRADTGRPVSPAIAPDSVTATGFGGAP